MSDREQRIQQLENEIRKRFAAAGGRIDAEVSRLLDQFCQVIDEDRPTADPDPADSNDEIPIEELDSVAYRGAMDRGIEDMLATKLRELDAAAKTRALTDRETEARRRIVEFQEEIANDRKNTPRPS